MRRLSVFMLWFSFTVAIAFGDEDLWVPEVSFVHTEEQLECAVSARFSKDERFIEVDSQTPDEANGPAQSKVYRYDPQTGKIAGELDRGSLERIWPPSKIGDWQPRSSSWSSTGRFILFQMSDGHLVFDKEQNLLYSIPANYKEERAYFSPNDDQLLVTGEKGFDIYAMDSGKKALSVNLGFRPFHPMFSEPGNFVACCDKHISYSDTSWTLVSLSNARRLGAFKGGNARFSKDETLVALNSNGDLEIRSLPEFKKILKLKSSAFPRFILEHQIVIALEVNDGSSRGVAAWDLTTKKARWRSALLQNRAYYLIDEIAQDKVIFIQNDQHVRLLEISTGRILFDFKSLKRMPQFAHLEPSEMWFSFAGASMRFVTYWRLDKRKLQVIAWKPTTALK